MCDCTICMQKKLWNTFYYRFFVLEAIRFSDFLILVACYATLHPALSVGRSD